MSDGAFYVAMAATELALAGGVAAIWRWQSEKINRSATRIAILSAIIAIIVAPSLASVAACGKGGTFYVPAILMLYISIRSRDGISPFGLISFGSLLGTWAVIYYSVLRRSRLQGSDGSKTEQ